MLCVCVFLYFLARCPRGQQRIFPKKAHPVPNSLGVKPGHPFLLLPYQTAPPDKGNENKSFKEKTKGNERQYRRPCTIIEPQPTPRPRAACREEEPLGRLRAPLLPLAALAYIFSLPPRCTCRCPAPNTGVLQELKDRLRGPLVPQLAHRRCSRVLPPAVLAHSPPQPMPLRRPRPALDEEVMSRFPRSAVAPPAPVWIEVEGARHSFVKKGSDRCMSGQ